jgi:hypothetical protein
MKTKILTKSASGDHAQASATVDNAVSADFAVQPSDRLNLHSPQAGLIARKRVGNALALDFDDGQTVVMDGFYAPQPAESAATLVVSTSDSSEIFVGAVDGATVVAQGPVEGARTSASGGVGCPEGVVPGTERTGPSLVGGTGEVFTGMPQDWAAQGQGCLRNFGGAVGNSGPSADPSALTAGDGQSSDSGIGGFLMSIAPFVPQFLALVALTQVIKDDARSPAEVAVGQPSTPGNPSTPDSPSSLGNPPTLQINAISTDTGASDTDFVTSDTTLTLSGSSTGMTTAYRAQVSSDGGLSWHDLSVLEGGHWSYVDLVTHEDPFTYELRVVDAANRVQFTASQSVIVDTHASDASDGVVLAITGVNDDVAPGLGNVPDGGATNDTSPTVNGTLTGTLAAGEEIAIYRDGLRLGAAVISGANWSFTDSGLADGSHSYMARVEDVAGNHGAASPNYTIVVDTVAHLLNGVVALSITSVQDNVGPAQGAVADGGITDDTSPTLMLKVEGTLPDGQSIVIYRDNVRIGTASVWDDVWSFTDRGVANGPHTYIARVEDATGNLGAVSSNYLITVENQDVVNSLVTVTITEVNDNVAPLTGAVPDHKSTNDTSPTVLGDFTGTLLAGEVIGIYRDGVRIGSATLAGNAWSFTDGGLADATYVYQAHIESAAGLQRVASGNYTITVDTVPPDMVHGVSHLAIANVQDNVGATQGDVANGGTTDDTSPTLVISVTGTLLVDEFIVIYRDNVRIGTASVWDGVWTFTDRGVVNGAHSYVARVEDEAGNRGAVSNSYSITVDNHDVANGVVTVAITEVDDNVAPFTGAVPDHKSTNDTSPTLSGDFTGTLASGAGIKVTYDGAGHLVMEFGAATTLNGIESVMRTVTYSGGAVPAAGDRAIEFALIDKAGAITTQESGITVESPALSVNGTTTGSEVLTGGNGNDGLVTHGGVHTVHGGNGDDHIYESNTALSGQYYGDSGFDTLVLDFSGNQNVNLGALVGLAHGIERIDLGNTSFKTNSTNLQIDDLASVAAITDAGVHRLLVQGGTGDSISLARSLQLAKVAASSQDHVNFDIYQAAGSDVQLWLQHGLAVSQV